MLFKAIMSVKIYKSQIDNFILVVILTIIGFYNSLAFIKTQEYIFHHFSATGDIIFSISFINALSFLFRPLGGTIRSLFQHRIKKPLLPYFVLVYAFYNIAVINFVGYFPINYAIITLIFNCVLIGILLGAIYPEAIVRILDKDRLSPARKVFVGNCYFIAVYFGAAFTKLTLADVNNPVYKVIISLMPLIFCIFALYFYLQRSRDISNTKEKMILYEAASSMVCIQNNFWTIIRFTCFLTFVTSLNAFFSTVMPFYLVRYLNYSESSVFNLQVVIFLFSIAGLVLGAIFHQKLGRRLHIVLGLLIKIILYFLFKAYIKNDYIQILIFESICMLFVGLMLSKILTVLDSIFEVKYKFGSISIIYNLTFGFFSGLGVFLSTYLISKSGNLYIPSIIIITFSYLSLVSLWFTPNKDFFRYIK